LSPGLPAPTATPSWRSDFEVSDTGNVVVYHAMPARPRYLDHDEMNEE
jgi:hypothetical protein